MFCDELAGAFLQWFVTYLSLTLDEAEKEAVDALKQRRTSFVQIIMCSSSDTHRHCQSVSDPNFLQRDSGKRFLELLDMFCDELAGAFLQWFVTYLSLTLDEAEKEAVDALKQRRTSFVQIIMCSSSDTHRHCQSVVDPNFLQRDSGKRFLELLDMFCDEIAGAFLQWFVTYLSLTLDEAEKEAEDALKQRRTSFVQIIMCSSSDTHRHCQSVSDPNFLQRDSGKRFLELLDMFCDELAGAFRQWFVTYFSLTLDEAEKEAVDALKQRRTSFVQIIMCSSSDTHRHCQSVSDPNFLQRDSGKRFLELLDMFCDELAGAFLQWFVTYQDCLGLRDGG